MSLYARLHKERPHRVPQNTTTVLVNAEHLLHSMEISRNRDVLQAGGYGVEQGSWRSAQWDSGESITRDADWPA